MAVVDFAAVPEHQAAMHARLVNWGLWCRGVGYARMSPMFRMYRSTEVWAAPADNREPVDPIDAAKVAKGVIALPEDHRHAAAWYYIEAGSPVRACRRIGCGMAHLARLVIDGRTMLTDRKV